MKEEKTQITDGVASVLNAELDMLKQELQDWKDRYAQRMIAFEDMEADRNWYKSRVEKRTTEDDARFEFEKQHHDRDLSRHRLRGTYTKPAIAVNLAIPTLRL